jgi:hypothetical protein
MVKPKGKKALATKEDPPQDEERQEEESPQSSGDEAEEAAGAAAVVSSEEQPNSTSFSVTADLGVASAGSGGHATAEPLSSTHQSVLASHMPQPPSAALPAGQCLVQMSEESHALFLQFVRQAQMKETSAHQGGGVAQLPSLPASYGAPPAFSDEQREVVDVSSGSGSPAQGQSQHQNQSTKTKEQSPPVALPAKQNSERQDSKRALVFSKEAAKITQSSSSEKSSMTSKARSTSAEKKGAAVKSAPPKSPAKERGIWRCPNCGNEDLSTHDILHCQLPRRSDLSPSVNTAEVNLLKRIDEIRRNERKLHRELATHLEAADEDNSDSESIPSDEERSEDDDEEEGDSFLDDDESYQDSMLRSQSQSSQSRSQSRSQPSASSNSRSQSQSESGSSELARKPRKKNREEERLDRMEAMIAAITQNLANQDHPSGGGAARTYRSSSLTGHHPGSASSKLRSRSNSPSLSRQIPGGQLENQSESAGRSASSTNVTFSASASRKLPDGLIGCPEIQREELMSLEKFEALEKRYADYSDRAETWQRKKMPMAQCFHKFLPDVVLSLNSLLGRSEAVRRKFPALRDRDYSLDEDFLLSLHRSDFSLLYKELLTSRTIMASDVIADLISTSFHKRSKDKEVNLTHLIVQASSAFREKLHRQPTQTVSKCTRTQLRDAFIKMVLGKEEANLADFSECYTWEDAVKVMMDMEGSGQGVAFLQRVQAHQLDKDKLPDKLERRDGKTKFDKGRGEDGAADGEEHWRKRYEEMSDTIEHNESEMKGHTDTYRDRVVRLLQIQDARRRDSQMREMERGKSFSELQSGGGRAKSYASGGHSHKDDYRNSKGSFKSKFQRDDGRNSRGDSRGRRRDEEGASSGDDYRENKDRSRQQDRSEQKEQGDSQSKREQGSESRSQLGAAAPSTSRPERICYNCREAGHIASECPKPPRNSERNNSESRRSRSPSAESRLK